MLRLFTHFACFALLSGLTRQSLAAPTSDDPCAKIADQTFVDPADALACLKSFPFNEYIRGLLLEFPSSLSRVDHGHTCADPADPLYLLRGECLKSLFRQGVPAHGPFPLKNDYDFNKDLYDFTTQLNDGHTRTSCYRHVALLATEFCYQAGFQTATSPTIIFFPLLLSSWIMAFLSPRIPSSYSNSLATALRSFFLRNIFTGSVLLVPR